MLGSTYAEWLWLNDKDGNQILVNRANINTIIMFDDRAGIQFANGTGIICSLNDGAALLEMLGAPQRPGRVEPRVVTEDELEATPEAANDD